MTQQNFITRRQQQWDNIEKVISGGSKEVKANAVWFPRAFRELTGDLNTARSHAFDPLIIERLNRLVLEGNQLLYGQRSFSIKALPVFILQHFPAAVRKHWRGIAAVHLLFYGIMIFTAVLCVRFPEMVYEIMPRKQAFDFEQMYDPASTYYLTPREVASDADMFGFYIYNNVSIAFIIFAGGILAGIGSFFILCMNALSIGAAAGHVINKGFSETFFSFIIGHSSFELTAIVISAYAGFLLGFSFLVRRGLSRKASFKKAGETAVPLIMGSALLLFIAAVIEAFWSSRHELPEMLRYGAGICGWLLLLFFFLFSGRKKA